jgi:hypothetical protein
MAEKNYTTIRLSEIKDKSKDVVAVRLIHRDGTFIESDHDFIAYLFRGQERQGQQGCLIMGAQQVNMLDWWVLTGVLETLGTCCGLIVQQIALRIGEQAAQAAIDLIGKTFETNLTTKYQEESEP